LVTGAAGEAGFAAPTTGAGFGGVGFAGPPRGVCFIGAARGVCFLTPPIALWAEAGRQQALPNAAAIKIIASALFFMGPSPDVLTQTIRYAAYTSYTNYCRE
jgi:hypothetical protein